MKGNMMFQNLWDTYTPNTKSTDPAKAASKREIL